MGEAGRRRLLNDVALVPHNCLVLDPIRSLPSPGQHTVPLLHLHPSLPSLSLAVPSHVQLSKKDMLRFYEGGSTHICNLGQNDSEPLGEGIGFSL